MTTKLLMPIEVDRTLRYPAGRSERLAKRGKLPHLRLPSGEIRFRESDLRQILASVQGSGEALLSSLRPADPLGAPMLSLEEMAGELEAEPGWILAQVRAGLLPAVLQDDRLWFRPEIVKPIVERWSAQLVRLAAPADRPPKTLEGIRTCDADDGPPADGDTKGVV